MRRVRSTCRFAGLVAGAVIVCAATVMAAGAGVSKQEAAQCARKLQAIHAHAETASRRPLRTALTEGELNAYLALDAGKSLPPGILTPQIQLLGGGRLTGRAVVDLDAVRKARTATPGLLNPMGLLSGRLPVSVTGVLHSANGQARFDLQTARVGGVSVPAAVIDELLAYYSRTSATPDGFSLDSPFPLPDRIQQIDVQHGQAVVVQ